MWAGVVRCMAHLDALLSLADVSGLPGFSRPHLYEGPSMPSFIRFTNARHPCLAQTHQGGEYIPNHGILGTAPVDIAGDDAQIAPNMLLLTGPNMGGKSTLLRQTCLAVILAQVSFDTPLGLSSDTAHQCKEICLLLNPRSPECFKEIVHKEGPYRPTAALCLIADRMLRSGG